VRVDDDTLARDERLGQQIGAREGVSDQRLFTCGFCEELRAVCRVCDRGQSTARAPVEESRGGESRRRLAVGIDAPRRAALITGITSERGAPADADAWGIRVPRTWPDGRRCAGPRPPPAPQWIRPTTRAGAPAMTSIETITVTISPEPSGVRILATTAARDVLKASLPPVSSMHPRAAATLLEGLALWHQRPLSVVLSADALDDGCALGLCDALGFGRTLHYEVGVALADGRRGRRRDLRGLGDFRDLRALSAGSVL